MPHEDSFCFPVASQRSRHTTFRKDIWELAMKLTNGVVGKISLPKGKSDAVFFDDDLTGFGLRIRAGGSRKYVLHYRQAGVQRRHTIGNANVMTVEEARRRARKVLVAVDDGKDPAAEK